MDRVMDLLNDWLPERTAAVDLRGWEWHYLRRLFDLEMLTLELHAESATGPSFSADGSQLAVGAEDGSVKVWNARTGRAIATYRLPGKAVCEVAFSPDGSRLAAGDDGGVVNVWDLASGRAVIAVNHDRLRVSGLLFSPDGTLLLSRNNSQADNLGRQRHAEALEAEHGKGDPRDQ